MHALHEHSMLTTLSSSAFLDFGSGYSKPQPAGTGLEQGNYTYKQLADPDKLNLQSRLDFQRLSASGSGRNQPDMGSCACDPHHSQIQAAQTGGRLGLAPAAQLQPLPRLSTWLEPWPAG